MKSNCTSVELEVIGDAAAIIDSENLRSMAERLHKLAADDALKNRLRGAGLALARKFDWNETVAETLKVYERAANGIN